MSLDAAKAIIVRRGWLSRVAPSFQRAVLDRCHLQSIGAGKVLYRLGDPAGGMFGVVSGAVALEVAPVEAGPHLSSLMLSGTWFGEVSAFTGRRRRVNARATRDAEILYLPVQAVDAITAADPLAWREFYRVTLDHLDRTFALADDLMRKNHVHRFVGVLLHVAGQRFDMDGDAEEAVDLDVGQETLAEVSGMSRTTAVSILGDLQEAGFLELSYRRIRVLKPHALRAMLRES